MKNLVLIGFSPEEISVLKPVFDKLHEAGFETCKRQDHVWEDTVWNSDELPHLVFIRTGQDRDYKELLGEVAGRPCGPLLFLSPVPDWQELRTILGYFTDLLLPVAWDYLPLNHSREEVVEAINTLLAK